MAEATALKVISLKTKKNMAGGSQLWEVTSKNTVNRVRLLCRYKSSELIRVSRDKITIPNKKDTLTNGDFPYKCILQILPSTWFSELLPSLQFLKITSLK